MCRNYPGVVFGRGSGVEPTSIVSSPVDGPARLSSVQRRDLLGQAVAAVITTALIAAPLVTPPSETADVASLPAQSFAAAVAAVAVGDMQTSPVVRERIRVAASRARLRASTRFASAAVAPIAVLPQAVGTSGATPASAPRKPLSRRLTGWLTGDGTHTVRPFPSVTPGRP